MQFIKRHPLILVIIVFLLPVFKKGSGGELAAQSPKTFSADSVKFLSEMDDFFSNVRGKEKEGHEFIKEQFKPFWFGGHLNADKRIFVYNTSIAMLQKKFRPYPEYFNFFSALINFYSKANQPESSFMSWKMSLEKLLSKGSARKVSDFLEASNDLFGNNKLEKSAFLEWYTATNNYIFEFDSLPKITFQNTDLFCAVKGDTSVILGTTGVFYPTEKKWVGKGGKVTWKRDGLDESQIYAELKKYSILLTKQGYTADSVKLTNKVYFINPLIGMIEDKAVPDATPETATYPRFQSYSTHFEIKNLADGKVDFSGGFTLRGSKFIGSGNANSDASLIFKRNEKPLLKASSKTFIFHQDRITSDEASILVFLNKDSIYHPSLKLKFDIKNKSLILIRTLEGISKTPFFNTFHKVDMYIEEVDWKLDSAKIDFKSLIGSAQGIADFVSSNYFRNNIYQELQGLDQLNPLVALKQCSEKLGKTTFTGEDYAHFRRVEPQAIRPYLIPIANGGFILYNPQDDKIIIQDRLFSFLKAKTGTADYDVINIHSEMPGGSNNAVLNLLNYDLRINGVSQIVLSDSQNVTIYPARKQIVLKKNRDFSFGGVVNAGRFAYYGKDYFFNYDNFKIDINGADSLMFTVKRFTPDPFGNFPEMRVKSVIEQINGDLQIDHPGNKSGRKTLWQYPIFTSSKESFVYYDRRSIQRGTYKRDKFYFKLDPYSLDSLDNFSTKGLRFAGQLTSAGIFPDFRDSLAVQQDYSLGFIRSTPSGGYLAYGDAGKYNNTIRLSNEGLRGTGKIDFLTSTISSQDMIFFPDSANGKAEKFEIKEQKGGKAEYPNVKGDTVFAHWVPKKGLMQVYTLDKPLDMYNGQAGMKGRIDYSASALTGNGKLDFSGATLAADLLKFKNKKVLSDTAFFSLKALQESQFAFSTKNVNTVIDFEKRTGDFASNGKGTIVDFPVNQYICYMDNFKWFMDKGDIELSSRESSKPKDERLLELSGPEFVSTNPKQDSLRFNAPSAKFDFKNYIITAKKVAWINVADAKIYPDSGSVTILKNAEMKTLTNAKIVANSITAYHTIEKVNANVFGRKNYVASGYYNYIDEMKNKQPIYFVNIKVDTTFQTVAEAEVKDSSHFKLSPNYEFKGKVNLASNNQFLVFSGMCKITHTCAALQEGKTWFQFTSQINPEKILIPITAKLLDDKDKEIQAGIMVSTDTSGIYSAFLTKQIRKTDKEVIGADGFLYYDKASHEYRISSKEKLNESSLTGNFISLKTNYCSIYAEGKMGELGLDLGQVKIDAVGTATHELKKDSAKFQVMMALDFFFDNSALDKMADVIAKADAAKGTSTNAAYEKGLRELVGKEQADKLISELNLYGKFKKFPDELNHTLFLTDVNLVWDKRNNAYISRGDIGVSMIQKNQINKSVTGKIALWKKRAGDILDIYLEVDKATWYYFRYTKGLLTAVSSDAEFNKAIQDLKSDKCTLKVERGETPYRFSIGSEQQKNIFDRKLKSNDGGDD